jgi:hypothetical protein
MRNQAAGIVPFGRSPTVAGYLALMYVRMTTWSLRIAGGEGRKMGFSLKRAIETAMPAMRPEATLADLDSFWACDLLSF